MINWINEYDLNPGVYEHYKGGIYIVQNLITHSKKAGKVKKLRDPMVVYRDLDNTYKTIERGKNADGSPYMARVEVIKNYMTPLSEFLEHVLLDDKLVPRFKKI